MNSLGSQLGLIAYLNLQREILGVGGYSKNIDKQGSYFTSFLDFCNMFQEESKQSLNLMIAVVQAKPNQLFQNQISCLSLVHLIRNLSFVLEQKF